MSSAKEALVRCPLRAVAPTEEAKSNPAICPQQRRLWCGAHSGRLPTQGGCLLRAVAYSRRLPAQGGCPLRAVAYSRRLPTQGGCLLKAVTPTEEAKSMPAMCPRQRRLWCGYELQGLYGRPGCLNPVPILVAGGQWELYLPPLNRLIFED